MLFLSAIRITQEGPPPGEAPFAAQLLSNGLVIPLITLGFGSVVLLPLLTVLVAGDAIAGEVSAGTLKTMLGRSVGARACSGPRPRPSGCTLSPSWRSSSGSGCWQGGWRSGSSRWRASAARRHLRRRGHSPHVGQRRPRGAAAPGPRGLRRLSLFRHPQQRRVRGRRGRPDPAPPARLDPRARRRSSIPTC